PLPVWKIVLSGCSLRRLDVRMFRFHVCDCCTPQKSHAISRGNFFQPIFMVQPAENILDSDPGGCWQLMPLKFRSREWIPTENAWPQAGVWASVIVVGNPLPQDRSKMPLT